MANPSQLLSSMLRSVSLRRTVLRLTISCVLLLLAVPMAHAQTFSVIHTFTGQGDGADPEASLTLNGGILYGTASYGGGVNGRGGVPRTMGCGTVFQMKHQEA